jgi:hypothetical protein
MLQVVDAVLAVKTTNDKGEIKYPIKVCILNLLQCTLFAFEDKNFIFLLPFASFLCAGWLVLGTGNQHSQGSWKECKRELFAEWVCPECW